VLFVALFGLTLLPRLAERLTRPLVSAGSRLSEAAGQDNRPRPGASFLIGVATGALGAVRRAHPRFDSDRRRAARASIATTLLLLAYAAGAATSLAAALLLGGKVFAR
jgi:cytochrome c biogenesis protein CcdA